jgi:hypothetical protein
MTTFNFRNVIVKPTRLNNLLDPIIISDTMTPLYSDVFEMPSEINLVITMQQLLFSNVQNRLHVHLPDKFGSMRI